MKRIFFLSVLFSFGISCFIFAESAPPLGPMEILIGDDPGVLFLLECDARQIRKVPVEGGRPEILRLPMEPTRMRFFPDRRRLAVVGGGPHGRLLVVDTVSLTIETEIVVGHSPADVVVPLPRTSDDAIRIYVANRFGGDISVVSLLSDGSGREERRFPAGREPIALASSSDGKQLIVVGHLPEDPASRFDIASRVRIVSTETGEATVLRLPPGAMSLRDIVLEPRGRYAFITGLLGHFEHLPDSVGSGWMNENLLYVIDVQKRSFAGTHHLDEHGIGTANPWGLALSDDGRRLVVAAAGSADVVLLDLEMLAERFDRFNGYAVSETPSRERSSETFLPAQMRIPTGLKGVRHVATANGRIYATAFFDDAVARIEPVFTKPYDYIAGLLPRDDVDIPRKQNFSLRRDVTTPIRTNYVLPKGEKPFVVEAPETVAVDAPLRFIPLPPFSLARGIRFNRSFARLGPEPPWDDVRYGEMLFHDASLCEEHWQSCSSCHPGGRSDALNWDLLNDGQDNPKSTKSLLLSHETPPSMSTGIRPSAEIAVRKGFETILMIPATEEEARAVDAYLENLRPVPSPTLVFDRMRADDPGRLSDAAKRGKRLFNSDRVGCAVCHPEPLFTDMRKYDVGTQSSVDPEPWFDTPTLIEVWRSAPYLHDGRYKTIREVIVEGKHVDADGRLDRLTDKEIDDLVEYVLSL